MMERNTKVSLWALECDGFRAEVFATPDPVVGKITYTATLHDASGEVRAVSAPTELEALTKLGEHIGFIDPVLD